MAARRAADESALALEQEADEQRHRATKAEERIARLEEDYAAARQQLLHVQDSKMHAVTLHDDALQKVTQAEATIALLRSKYAFPLSLSCVMSDMTRPLSLVSSPLCVGWK